MFDLWPFEFSHLWPFEVLIFNLFDLLNFPTFELWKCCYSTCLTFDLLNFPPLTFWSVDICDITPLTFWSVDIHICYFCPAWNAIKKYTNKNSSDDKVQGSSLHIFVHIIVSLISNSLSLSAHCTIPFKNTPNSFHYICVHIAITIHILLAKCLSAVFK